MAPTRRLILSLLPALLLCAKDRKKDKDAEGGNIKVVELKVRRSDSDRSIAIDGRIANSGERPIRGLVLIFEATDADGHVLSRQRGQVDEDPLDPAAQSEFHWQMRDQATAVDLSVRAVAHDDRPVKVEAPGPYPID